MDIGHFITQPNTHQRADLYCAQQELAVALLQTVMMPQNHHEWYQRYTKPPSAQEVQAAFATVAEYFQLLNPDGPAFMQDYALPAGERRCISALLIDTPGEQTLKHNKDHFIKRGGYEAVCEQCCFVMLYALQTWAPVGGAGHRTSLRGGGPLLTLIEPPETSVTDAFTRQWQRLWLNVLPQQALDDINCKQVYKSVAAREWDVMFPWLRPTLDSTSGDTIYPQHIHLLETYWAMPRRIRLDHATLTSGTCDCCGEQHDTLVTHYITKNYGNKYADDCRHPLSPYRNNDEAAISAVKGKQGGQTYQDWLGLALPTEGNAEKGSIQPALVVSDYLNEKCWLFGGDAGNDGKSTPLLCFGYDMDNMKARNFYYQRFPLFHVTGEAAEQLHAQSVLWIGAAKTACYLLRTYIKSALFKTPKEVKGTLPYISRHFWQTTEPAFFRYLKRLVQHINDDAAVAHTGDTWRRYLYRACIEQFDHWVFDAPDEERDLGRIVSAKNRLSAALNKDKAIVVLKTEKE